MIAVVNAENEVALMGRKTRSDGPGNTTTETIKSNIYENENHTLTKDNNIRTSTHFSGTKRRAYSYLQQSKGNLSSSQQIQW